MAVELRQYIESIEQAECDEMWSFVGSKAHQRWLWYAIDHATGKILAYVGSVLILLGYSFKEMGDRNNSLF